MKAYYYTNDRGLKKIIHINTENLKNGKYHFMIWNAATGDLCSNGYDTKENIIDFLKNYGIKADF